MAPAPEPYIRERLAVMTCTMKMERVSDGVVEVRTRELLALFGDIPADIWLEASREIQKTLEWFPVPAEFEKALRPLVERRKKAIRRLKAIRSLLEEPPTAPAPAPTPASEDRAAAARKMAGDLARKWRGA